ncbi:hypothetical protein [Nostoc sp.]|uniref:hypothetical protein n=1 Tax=Nostoc sp. TaxID=1180 RepID=UPI003593180C
MAIALQYHKRNNLVKLYAMPTAVNYAPLASTLINASVLSSKRTGYANAIAQLKEVINKLIQKY